jgi:hypothetical protein
MKRSDRQVERNQPKRQHHRSEYNDRDGCEAGRRGPTGQDAICRAHQADPHFGALGEPFAEDSAASAC